MTIEKTECDFCKEDFEYHSYPWLPSPTTCRTCSDVLRKEREEKRHRDFIKGLSLEERVSQIERTILHNHKIRLLKEI